jgi:hypothetical protein
VQINLMKSVAICCALLVPAIGQAATVTTDFDANNGAGGNMFDVVIGSNALTLQELGINTNRSGTYSFYYKTGSYNGFQQDESAWTLHSQAAVTQQGFDEVSTFDITDLTLNANTQYGFFVVGPRSYYTNGNSSGTFTNGLTEGDLLTSNGDIAIYLGVGQSDADFDSNGFGSGGIGRAWNGSITYSVVEPAIAVPLPAGLVLGGTGLIIVGGMSMRRRRRRY